MTTAEQVIAQVPFRPFGVRETQVVFEVMRDGGRRGGARAARPDRAASGGTSVAEAIVPAVSLPPGRYTMRAKIRPGNATPLTRSFVVEAAPAGARAV